MQQISSDNKMTDRQEIEALYREMYQAMIAKDTATLNRIHAPEFVLTHMTGMQQPKREYIQAINNGMLNYYSAQHQHIEVTIDGDQATLVGRSRVEAIVFGGSRHTWPLQLSFSLNKRQGQWLLTSCKASTY